MSFKRFTPRLFATAMAGAMLLGMTAAADAKIVIRANIYGNPQAQGDTPSVKSMLFLKKKFEERVGDKAEIKIFWDNQLAKTYESAVNALQNGVIHISDIPMTTMAEYTNAYVPMSNLFLIPYPHSAIAYRVIDGEIGKTMTERVIKDAGLRAMSYWAVGFRHLTSVSKQIRNLDDLQGMKIRVQPNPVHLAAFEALGANPTPIPWGELFTALQQGVVDGAENPFDNIYQARLYEPQKNITLTGHAFEFVCYLTGEQFYQSLPKDVQEAWDASFAEATAYHRTELVKSDKRILQFLANGQMEVFELPADELKRFRDKVKPAWNVSKELVGEEYYNKIIDGVAKVEADYLANKK